MIHTYIPYCPSEKGNNLGYAYNNFMCMIDVGDWACFLDHDAMFTTREWYVQIESIVAECKDYGLLTCYTNRVNCKYQCPKSIDRENHDVRYHRKIGQSLKHQHGNAIMDITSMQPRLSGMLMLVSKKAWAQVNGFKSGFLSVDNDFHNRLAMNGLRVGLMKGIYVYHWYRGDGDLSHIK